MPSIEGMSFWDTAITIFFVFNAMGMIPGFVSLLARYDHKKQVKIIIRELLIALFVLLAFTFFGARILKSLMITSSTIGIGGGLLLVIIALNLIFPKMDPTTKKDVPGTEPFIIPLAIPGLAGPGSIAAMMIFSAQASPMIASAALIVAWIPSLILILAASFIKRMLGDKGLLAVEKIGGMIIFLIGIETFSRGVIEMVSVNFLS